MKLFKRTIMLFSVIAVLVSAMTITASAATSVTMKAKIQSFPYLYHGVSYPSAVRALQRFLICMDYSQHDTLTKDGLDGGFGPNVEAAVRYFQVSNGIRLPNGTGEVASQTWGAIADNLFGQEVVDEAEDGTHVRLKNVSGDRVYYANTANSQYHFAYYQSNTYRDFVYWKWI